MREIRTFDALLAAALLIGAAPAMGGVAAAILLVLGRPVLHVSRRVGRGGVDYSHYKFRTMRPGPQQGRVFFEQQRLGRLGRALRALHLDELPELWHILRGQMSFVGPRPLPRSLLEGLDASVRPRVPPGWTGPAQLWLLEHGQLDKRLQLELDARYVERRSLSYNLQLLGATLRRALRPAPLNLDPDATPDRRAFSRLDRHGDTR